MNNKILTVLLAVYHRIIWLLAMLAAVFLVAITIGVGAEAIMRSTKTGLVFGIVDFSEHVMFCMALLPAPYILSQNGHISVEIFIAIAPPKVAKFFTALIEAIGFVVCAVITYFGAIGFFASYSRGELIFSELIIPDWWVQWQIPLVFALMTIEFALRFARALRTDATPLPTTH